MPRPRTFHWHPATRLTPVGQNAEVQTGLTALRDSLRTQSPFCIGAPQPVTDAETPVFFTLTGGSSGQPKVIERSQASWIASFRINAARFDYTATDTLAVFGNLGHSLALYGVLEGIHLGLGVHILAGTSPAQQRQTIAQDGITILYVTPTQLRLLSQNTEQPLPAVRLILCGGGALEDTTRDATHALCPNAEIHVFYGAAETSFVTLADGATPTSSVGQPYPNVDLSLHNTDPQTGIGEIAVRSPYLFRRYAAGHSPDTRWIGDALSVGEYGRQDENGALWITGRKSRMVQIADQSIFPETVEQAITTHLNGTLCAVLPRPDALRGHSLHAVVETHSAADADTLAHRIREYCRHTLGALHTPKTVTFIAQMPLLGSGKPDLVSLEKTLP